MGQHKKKIFHQMFFVFVCQMQIVIVVLEYKVEGERTDTEGALPEMELKQIVEILY